LGVSESQVLKYERAGLLRPVTLPDPDHRRSSIRAVRHVAEEVHALAQTWIASASSGSTAAGGVA
jgi:hypothetical protein